MLIEEVSMSKRVILALPQPTLESEAYQEAMLRRAQLLRTIISLLLKVGITLTLVVNIVMIYVVWFSKLYPVAAYINFAVSSVVTYVLAGLLIWYRYETLAFLTLVI